MCLRLQSHVRSAELENTKLSAELQMLKAVELNREVTIAQYQEELHRLRSERDTHPAEAVIDVYLKNKYKYIKYIYYRSKFWNKYDFFFFMFSKEDFYAH